MTARAAKGVTQARAQLPSVEAATNSIGQSHGECQGSSRFRSPVCAAAMPERESVGRAMLCPFGQDEIHTLLRACHQSKLSRSEEHTSELQSLMRISYAVFRLKKQKKTNNTNHPKHTPVTNFK